MAHIIQIEINSCKECPFFTLGSDYSTDGWDRGNDWFCRKMDNKQIANFVERNEKPDVPEWCPCEIKNAEIDELDINCDIRERIKELIELRKKYPNISESY